MLLIVDIVFFVFVTTFSGDDIFILIYIVCILNWVDIFFAVNRDCNAFLFFESFSDLVLKIRTLQGSGVGQIPRAGAGEPRAGQAYPDAQKVLINKENVIFKKKTNNNKILHPDFKHFFKIQV